MATDETGKLVKLGDTDQTIARGDEDIRGRKVKDKNGEDIGKVDDLLVDVRENKVRFLEVASGGLLGLGATTSFIPGGTGRHMCIPCLSPQRRFLARFSAARRAGAARVSLRRRGASCPRRAAAA